MTSVIKEIELRHAKKSVVNVKSGDTVRVHQRIVEGGKERVQVFEGLVIRTSRRSSLTSSFTVRRIASGVGVEKSFLIHSPTVLKIEVTKRSKVRRNYLTYMRGLTGKSARLSSVDFDRKAVNEVNDKQAEDAEEAIKEAQAEAYLAPEKPQADAEAKEPRPNDKPKDEAQKLEEQPKLRPSAKNPQEQQNKEKESN